MSWLYNKTRIKRKQSEQILIQQMQSQIQQQILNDDASTIISIGPSSTPIESEP